MLLSDGDELSDAHRLFYQQRISIVCGIAQWFWRNDCLSFRSVSKGSSIVDHRLRFSTLSASYDDFLFASVCEEANGTHLSVLSALARMDVDPWEEASRLASMPKATAEKSLISILDLVSGKSWKSPEAAAVAARLVRLLPRPGEAAVITATAISNAATTTAKSSTHRVNYRWLWLGLWIAMSFMMPHHQATTTSANAATSESGTTSHSTSGTSDPVGLSR